MAEVSKPSLNLGPVPDLGEEQEFRETTFEEIF